MSSKRMRKPLKNQSWGSGWGEVGMGRGLGEEGRMGGMMADGKPVRARGSSR
jgi:hypothetical protein